MKEKESPTPTHDSPSARVASRVTRALSRAGFDDYLTWWDGEHHVVAAGARAHLRLEGRVMTLRDTVSGRAEQVVTADPFVDAGRLLAKTIDGPFRAWGYLGFGLATFQYPLYAKTRKTELHLIIPQVTGRIAGEGGVSFEGDESSVARANAALADFGEQDTHDERKSAASSLDAVEGGRAEYEAAVREVLAAIHAARVEKVILSRHVLLAGRLDPLATFITSARTQAARRFAFTLDGIRGAGACPEFLLVADSEGRVVTNPLAGTQPRGATEAEDAQLHARLLTDAKETSEHALSIRLAYDEIASVCTAETTRVVDFMRVKRYPFTQHLSSRAAGTVALPNTTWDALRAVFPGVTVTGIRKHDALGLIDRLESAPRGVYGGAVGWVDHTGAMDWGIAIRSVFDYGDGAVLNAGAGIVRDSEVSYEFDESAHKMRTMASKVILDE